MFLYLKVCYVVLIVVDEFYKRLLEDYMLLLLEIILFFVEFMEGKLNLLSWIDNI